MAVKTQENKTLSDVDRVFLAMQQPLKRVAKSLVKEQRERKRNEAATMKEPSKHSTPTTFKFDGLEEQTAHALNILRILELTLMEGNNNFAFTDEDLDAMAMLLANTNSLLKPLDLRGVAGALELGQFAIVQTKDSRRPTIACARCDVSGGKEA
jgi:hypothetical protein